MFLKWENIKKPFYYRERGGAPFLNFKKCTNKKSFSENGFLLILFLMGVEEQIPPYIKELELV